jgi:NADPH:quinone reductase-like Zn-dependent oxidoreductase
MADQQFFRLVERIGFNRTRTFRELKQSPRKHEALVKVHSVALNFRHSPIVTSQHPFPVKEKVVHCPDAAGEIVEVGAGGSDFYVGDKVVAYFDPTNLYSPQVSWYHGQGGPVDNILREFVVLPAIAIVNIPETSLSFAQWASLVITGVASWNTLYGNIPLLPGQNVLFQVVYTH